MSSIKDVARVAGFLTATIPHVINNTRFVSGEVRARVTQAIEQCRYYPKILETQAGDLPTAVVAANAARIFTRRRRPAKLIFRRR